MYTYTHSITPIFFAEINTMPSQVKAATEELASVLKTIDNVVTKRANAGYLDAGNGKLTICPVKYFIY